MDYEKEPTDQDVVLSVIEQPEEFYLRIPQTDEIQVEECLFSYSPEELADEIRAGLEKIRVVLSPPDILSFERLDILTQQFLPAKVRFRRELIETIQTSQIQEGEFLCTIIEKGNGETCCFEISQNGFQYEDLPDYLFEKIE